MFQNRTDLGVDKVFVGGPFMALIDAKSGLLPDAEISRLSTIIEFFENAGCHVYNAHRREGWGSAILPPEECSELDHREISDSDLFVAFPGSPASPGTHVEIGWATAMGKPTVLLLEADKDYTFLVTGLPAWTNTEILVYQSGPTFMDDLAAAVDRVMSRHGRLATAV